MNQTSTATSSQFNPAPPALRSGTIPDLLRCDGVAELLFGETGGRTGVLDLHQKTPCRVLFPKTHRGELTTAVLLTTSGGLTGGDRIRVTVSTQAGATRWDPPWEQRADGVLLVCEPAQTLPLAQRYFLF